jgi:serine/threonine protein kinase
MAALLRYAERNDLFTDRNIEVLRVKGNILITRDGRACLGDFGIVGAFGESSFTRFKLGTAQYMALERLDFFNGSPSEKSDVYSLAMTSFTVGTTLYHERDQDSKFFLISIRS